MNSDSSSDVGGASSSRLSTQNIQKQDASTTWEYFNPFAEVDIHHGRLPHWYQENVWYFVTYRLADALPESIVKEIQQQRDQWKKKRHSKELSKAEIAEYHRLFSQRYETLLHADSGCCLLKDPENAKIVTEAFRFFEHKRYELDELIVMPNHVHVLVRPLTGHKLTDILHSWKSFTSNKINKRMGLTGQLWQHESYDHIIRDKESMNAIRKYIRENPTAK